MTERKSPDISFHSWVEKQIREATERGEFDNLPGAGKPIPDLDQPHDELRWVKRKIEEEGLSSEALLPTPLRLRKEIERLPDTVRDMPSEQAVRDVVAELNRRIVDWLRAPSGPRVPVRPVNTEDLVKQWRVIREADRVARSQRATAPPRASGAAASTPAGQPATAEPPSRRPRWWRRIVRRWLG